MAGFVWNEGSAVWHSNRCFQNPLDNKIQLFVVYSQSPYLPHQLTVIYIIEKALYIKLNHIMQIHSLEHGIGSLHGVFYGAVRAKAVAIVAEFRFADRLHDLLDTLLYQPVPDTGNT